MSSPAQHLDTLAWDRADTRLCTVRVNNLYTFPLTPLQLTFTYTIQPPLEGGGDDDAAAATAPTSSSSSAAQPQQTRADMLLAARGWNSGGMRRGAFSSQTRQPPTLESVIVRHCARKVLLDHHKYTRPGHAAADMLLAPFKSAYDLVLNQERVNASFVRLRPGIKTVEAHVPGVTVVHHDAEARRMTLRFEHPWMAYHFVDRISCAFDAPTAAAVMAWWRKEVPHVATTTDEWCLFGMQRRQLRALADILCTAPPDHYPRAPLTMHTKERWSWTPDPESMACAPAWLMFCLRVSALMYRGAHIAPIVTQFDDVKVAHVLGVRAHGLLRRHHAAPTQPVERLENEYEQYRACALQYIYTICAMAFLLEMAGLRGLSQRDALYHWDTLERVASPQHVLQGADAAYAKLERARRGALVRAPPSERPDAAKKRYLDAAGNSQRKVTGFFTTPPSSDHAP